MRRMSNSSEAPRPSFVQYLSVGSCSLIEWNGREHLLIGSDEGSVVLYELSTHKEVMKVFECSEKTPVVGCGKITDEEVWIQLRGREIIVMQRMQSGFSTKIRIPIRHHGFCRAEIWDNYLLYPHDVESGKHGIRFHSMDPNVSSYPPIVLSSSPLCIFTHSELVFVGDESSNLTIWKNGDVVEILDKMFPDPIFSIAVNSKSIWLGSAKTPLKVIKHDGGKLHHEVTSIHYPEEAAGCSTMVTSSSGKTVFAGFWDGSIRGYGTSSGSIKMLFDFHKSSLFSLHWSSASSCLIAASRSEISFWNIK